MDITIPHFIEHPAGNVWYLIYPLLSIGTSFHIVSDNVITVSDDLSLYNLVEMVYKAYSESTPIHVTHRDIEILLVAATCIIWRLLYDECDTSEKALKYIRDVTSFLPNKEKMRKFHPPIKVIFCGDRDSSTEFEEEILLELKRLPPYSTVIHGGCKGIDLYTEYLIHTQLPLLHIKSFPVLPEDWSRYGGYAGIKRNEDMLKEKPHLVLAFHPDISISKGTRNMMEIAHKAGIDVYIHDLKRKSKFEGDFNIL